MAIGRLAASIEESDRRAVTRLVGMLGWVGIVVSLPAIFAEPPLGFAVWCFSLALTLWSSGIEQRRAKRLDRLRLLTALYLNRQAAIIREIKRRR